jgi:hypothetical protein
MIQVGLASAHIYKYQYIVWDGGGCYDSPGTAADHPAAGTVLLRAHRRRQLPARDAGLLSRQFAALADPVRLRILSVLATAPGGAVCACDLVGPVGKSQPTVSHHLRVLRAASLVTAQRDGKNI